MATHCPLAAVQFEQVLGRRPLHPLQVLAQAYRADGFPQRLPASFLITWDCWYRSGSDAGVGRGKSYVPSGGGLLFLNFVAAVSDDLTVYNINHILSNVGGMVCDTLQVP